MSWDIWLIFLVLAVVVPWRGRIRLKQLLAKPRVESKERISLYLSTIAFQWIAAGIAAWRAWAHGYTRAELGWGTGPNLFRSVIAAVCGTAVLAGLHWLNFRRMGGLSFKRCRRRFYILELRSCARTGGRLCLPLPAQWCWCPACRLSPWRRHTQSLVAHSSLPAAPALA
jgi:hypothetical protein